MSKKLLLALSLPLSLSFANAQVFANETFEEYETGNFFETIERGLNAGQNNWLAYVYDDKYDGTQTSDNLGVSNFQIEDVDGVKKLRVESPNNTTGDRTLLIEGLDEAWDDRDSGNDAIKVSFDISLDDTTAGSFVNFHVSSGYKTVAGLSFSTLDKNIRGLAWESASGYTPTFIPLSDSPITYEANTTYHFTFIYDTLTKEVSWLCDALNIDTTFAGALDNTPENVEIYLSRLSEAHTPTTVYIDNFKQEFIPSRLATEDVAAQNKQASSIFPNPTSGKLKIELSKEFNRSKTSVQISDFSGRQLLKTNSTEIDLSTLKKGVYLLTLNDGKHSETQKIIKN